MKFLYRLAVVLCIVAVCTGTAGFLGDMFNRPSYPMEATTSLILLVLLVAASVIGTFKLFNCWRKEDASHEDPRHSEDTHTS